MYRQRGIKAVQSIVYVTGVKSKILKCLSTSRFTRGDKSDTPKGLHFLTVKFTLPDDYFDRKLDTVLSSKSCKFPGKIHVIKDEADEQRLVQDGVVCQDFQTQEALGMDLEHSLESPLPRVSVIQLASKENAVLWTCNQGNFREKLPPYLLSLLRGEVLKVGHDISQDAALVQNQYGECVNNMVDTLTWAKEMKCNPLNLRAVCAIFLHERLFKKAANSDWTKEELSDRQIMYAATDAWISLRAYEEMKRTTEVIGKHLSPPLESTVDVFRSRQIVKSKKNRRTHLRRKDRKSRALREKENIQGGSSNT